METLVTKAQVAASKVVVVETHDPANDLFVYTGDNVIYAVLEDEDRPLILVIDDPHEVYDLKRMFQDKIRFFRMKRSDYQKLRQEALNASEGDG